MVHHIHAIVKSQNASNSIP